MRGLVATTIALAVATGAPVVAAAEYHITAQTVGDGYQTLSATEDVINRRRLHQYLGLGVYDLTGDGSQKLSLVTLMRFDAELGLGDEDVDGLRSLRQTQLALQTAFLEGRGLLGGMVDLRAGRQLHADPIDFLMLDGVTLTVRSGLGLALELLAGKETNDVDSLTSSQLELDGVRILAGTQDDADKLVFGAAVVTDGFQYFRARIGYRRIFSRDFLESTENPATTLQAGAGNNLGYKINQEKVGAALYWRPVKGLHLDAAGSFDFYNSYVDTVRSGLRWQATDALDLQLQYVHLLPSFDADSIFNIFSSEPLNDVNLRTRIHLSDTEWLYVGGMMRLFGNEPCADPDKGGDRHKCQPVKGADDAPVTLAEGVSAYGAMAGWQKRYGGSSRAGVDLSFEDGYGGRRMLLDVGTVWNVMPRKLSLDGRVTALYFQDELQPNLGGVGLGYQMGGSYQIVEGAAVRLLGEQNFNRNQTNQFRVFMVLDLNYWM